MNEDAWLAGIRIASSDVAYGPAVEYIDGSQEWYRWDVRHRADRSLKRWAICGVREPSR